MVAHHLEERQGQSHNLRELRPGGAQARNPRPRSDKAGEPQSGSPPELLLLKMRVRSRPTYGSLSLYPPAPGPQVGGYRPARTHPICQPYPLGYQGRTRIRPAQDPKEPPQDLPLPQERRSFEAAPRTPGDGEGGPRRPLARRGPSVLLCGRDAAEPSQPREPFLQTPPAAC